MARRTLKFTLSSYWHVGSGAGAEALADAVILRDDCGLPTIPGRTIKGLLRDAMTLASLSGRIPQDRVIRWFGSALPGFDEKQVADGDRQEKLLEEARFSTSEAALWFGSARLPSMWREWARAVHGRRDPAKEDVLKSLVTCLSSTAIDQVGVARDKSLRVAEVAVPMELRAEIHGPDDDLGWVKDLETCLPLVRALGKRRSRGYGRVDVAMEDVS